MVLWNVYAYQTDKLSRMTNIYFHISNKYFPPSYQANFPTCFCSLIMPSKNILGLFVQETSSYTRLYGITLHFYQLTGIDMTNT